MGIDFNLKQSVSATIVLLILLIIYLQQSLSTRLFYRSWMYFMSCFEMIVLSIALVVMQILNHSNIEASAHIFIVIVLLSVILTLFVV